MKSIELTIKSTYLPDWTVKDGLREALQNAKDGVIYYSLKNNY